jgi:hypothetical protein
LDVHRKEIEDLICYEGVHKNNPDLPAYLDIKQEASSEAK